MKLRVQDNSIRMRLNRREVSQFATEGRVEARIEFAGNRKLSYVLERAEGLHMQAAFEGDCIHVRVPAPLAIEWTTTDEVVIRQRQTLAGGGVLDIVIEKDFQCMHSGSDGPDPEAFPNPLLPGDAH